MDIANSAQLFAEAQGYIPGGLNSPVRSFKTKQHYCWNHLGGES